MRERWTAALQAHVIGMVDQGMTIPQIAREMNRTQLAIKKRIMIHLKGGVPPKKVDAKVRVRPCLGCSRPFTSDGPHNRLCNSCRTNNCYW